MKSLLLRDEPITQNVVPLPPILSEHVTKTQFSRSRPARIPIRKKSTFSTEISLPVAYLAVSKLRVMWPLRVSVLIRVPKGPVEGSTFGDIPPHCHNAARFPLLPQAWDLNTSSARSVSPPIMTAPSLRLYSHERRRREFFYRMRHSLKSQMSQYLNFNSSTPQKPRYKMSCRLP